MAEIDFNPVRARAFYERDSTAHDIDTYLGVMRFAEVFAADECTPTIAELKAEVERLREALGNHAQLL
jgi:hypothetical protein